MHKDRVNEYDEFKRVVQGVFQDWRGRRENQRTLDES